MMRDVLLDIVKHTHSLGFIQAVKINGNNGSETEIEAMDDDSSVVLKGKLHNPVSDLTGTIGLGKLGVLSGYLNFEGYSDTKGKIEVVKKSRNGEEVAEELKLALQKSKINTTNAAIAIPVTSAIIRVVTAPLMTDEELKKAIDTDSLWENLVQLTDNLNDYSIFHQVINRDKTGNTMDILFVASKLSDINSYTDIIKKGGLNAVIIDVKCFALKSAVDQINQIAGSIEDSNLTAVLEFGLDENYVMILYENNPIITDIFIRSQDRKTLQESNNQEEMDALVRRYMTQVKPVSYTHLTLPTICSV